MKQQIIYSLIVLHSLNQSLQKGYDLAGQGLQGIGGHQAGEYQQHKTYFNSLYSINPTIYSPVKQNDAKNNDNHSAVSTNTSRQTTDSSRSH